MRSLNFDPLSFGLTNSVMFYANAAAFLLGANLIDNKMYNVTARDVMLVLNCMVFGAQLVGTAACFMPD